MVITRFFNLIIGAKLFMLLINQTVNVQDRNKILPVASIILKLPKMKKSYNILIFIVITHRRMFKLSFSICGVLL